jgi:hypothetical protein
VRAPGERIATRRSIAVCDCSRQCLILRHARVSELRPWLDLVATQGEIFVQFWLKPDEAVATLGA